MLKSLMPLSAALIAATVAGYSADDSRQYGADKSRQYRTDDSRQYRDDDDRQSNDYYDPCCSRFEMWFDPMGVKPCIMVADFATELIAQSDTVLTTVNNFLDSDFSFGFKIGAELVSNCPTWVFGAQYMWWENTMKGSTSVRGTGAVFDSLPTILAPTAIPDDSFVVVLPAPDDVGSISAKIKFKYNLLDVYGGWNCCACGGLQLTPYGGFRGWWYSTEAEEFIKQSNNLVYSVNGDLSTATNDYDAYGLMGGLGFEWNVCGQFYFFGSFGGSIIAGDNEKLIKFVSTGAAGKSVSFEQEMCLFVHSVEGKFGFNWNFCWCDIDYQIGAYYEAIQWNEVLPHPSRRIRTAPGSATETLNGLFLHQIAGRVGVSF